MLDKSRPGYAWFQDSARSKILKLHTRAQNLVSRDQLAFYAPDFALRTSEPWFLGETLSVLPRNEDRPQLKAHRQPQAESFFSAHADILKRIGLGEFQKVVPIVGEEFFLEGEVSAASLAKAPVDSLYSYGFEFDGEGMSGLTPELLFHVRGDRLETMALAGTGAFDGPSLLDDAKEMREHGIVIENIEHELGSLGAISIGQTSEKKFGQLKHLHTPIEVRLRVEPDFEQVVRALHPTAALGGWPRKPAWEYLRAQESSSWRSRFGAPFGFVEGDEMLCVVAIRNLQWKGREALVASGCGVVESSIAEREWQELSLKRRATLRNLGFEL